MLPKVAPFYHAADMLGLRRSKRAKGFSICTILISASLLLAAQGHRPPSGSVPGTTNSNAQSGPAAGQDRDTGKDRAEDVGKGKKDKKEGLEGDQGKVKKGHKKHQKKQLKKG